MIKLWRMADFKSVAEETVLELAPLTIFAGANSSGKSTIIQSMLLTAQTLQSSVYTRPVVLNGHMARLGAFTDIVSFSDEERAILIGFSLDLPPDRPAQSIDLSGRRPPRLYSRRHRPIHLTDITCFFKFSVKGARVSIDLARLQPHLEESSITVTASEEDGPHTETLHLKRSSRDGAQRAADFRLPPDVRTRPEFASLQYEIVQASSGVGISSEPLGMTRVGASLAHFLPTRISVVLDTVEEEVQDFVDLLTSASRFRNRDIEIGDDDPLENVAVRNILLDELESVLGGQDLDKAMFRRTNEYWQNFKSDPSADSLFLLYANMPVLARTALAQHLGEKIEALRKAVRGGRLPHYELRYIPLGDLVSAGTGVVSEFFTNSFKYLGPLRDEPKPVYPLAGSTDPRDVGFRGEHTAAVLDVHRETEVAFVPSASFEKGGQAGQPHSIALLPAVLDWLNYMGVGSSIGTLDRGKLGHELKIKVGETSLEHDLTQVGVGVSQVLPILVLSLLAEPGAVLIFEQPELHLHPRVQTRLADFFVSMTQLGKQCIVETHSEYLINRLRYRAAVTEGREISDSVIMYFVEKESEVSKYRLIRINEFGVIEDWPKGFFDESEETAAATLKAAMAKRKQRS